jgi:hypothetical protein
MRLIGWSIAAGLPVAAVAFGQATRPHAAPSSVEVRAMEEFNNGQYALALPLLKQATEEAKGQPDRIDILQEDMRVCERNLSLNQGAIADPPVNPAAPTVAQRKRHAAPVPGQTLEIAIKDLGNFEYDPMKGGGIPGDVKALSGLKVRLRGFMIPMDQAENITQFALVPSLFNCCQFGSAPQIQHTIVVHVPKGKAVSYYPDEVSVEGTLSVDEKREDGFIVSIFELATSSVKPAPK